MKKELLKRVKRNKMFRTHNAIINNLHTTILNCSSMMRFMTCYYQLSSIPDGDNKDKMDETIEAIRDLKRSMTPIGDDIFNLLDDFLSQCDE